MNPSCCGVGGDLLFEQVRDLNFARVGPWIKEKAKKVNDQYEKRHAAKTIHQIRQFVSNLKGIQEEHRSLQIHTNIAGYIMKVNISFYCIFIFYHPHTKIRSFH